MNTAVVKTSKAVKGMTAPIRRHFDIVERAREIYLDKIKRAEAEYFERIKQATPNIPGDGAQPTELSEVATPLPADVNTAA